MEVVAVFIPIVSTIVIGLAFVTWIYFRSRENQEEKISDYIVNIVKALFEKKKSPYVMLKIGVVILFFGIGLGIGLLIEVYTGVEQWIPFLLFAGVGLGFILAFVIGRKFEEKDKANYLD